TTASTQKDNPKTGDNNALVMVGALLLIVSAGALVLTTKKIGSR
ncbi:MAG: LPXTG cell wall anchor domain-containing protein, partial [Clostridiales bacterium]|nr:LPXTG cell wall anchor domain-containing protein [Clostridiales bacterium]